MTQTHVASYTMDIIALLFLFVLLHNDHLLGNHRKRAFSYGIIMTILVILSEMGTNLVNGSDARFRSFHLFCNALGFALAPLIPIILITIFDTKILKTHKLLLLPTVLNAVASFLSPLFGFLFFVDKNNHYERGKFFFVFVAVYIINILFFAMVIWYTGQKHLYPIKWKIVGLSFFTVTGTCVQLFMPKVYTSWHCVTLSLFLVYIILSAFEGSFDVLTGLFNRAAFEKASQKFTGKKLFSVIVMDINHFKEINDTYGHDYGDTVLKEVAAIIKNSFDSHCSCYRIGGDEFCVIRRDANREKLEHQLKCMTDNLGKERQNDSCLPTVAYGTGVFTKNEPLDFQKILKEADNQMYFHKQLQKKKGI